MHEEPTGSPRTPRERLQTAHPSVGERDGVPAHTAAGTLVGLPCAPRGGQVGGRRRPLKPAHLRIFSHEPMQALSVAMASSSLSSRLLRMPARVAACVSTCSAYCGYAELRGAAKRTPGQRPSGAAREGVRRCLALRSPARRHAGRAARPPRALTWCPCTGSRTARAHAAAAAWRWPCQCRRPPAGTPACAVGGSGRGRWRGRARFSTSLLAETRPWGAAFGGKGASGTLAMDGGTRLSY